MEKLYQKKYNVEGNWGGDWIDIKKEDLLYNIIQEKKTTEDRLRYLDRLYNGEEIELGLFKFRIIKK